MVLVFGVYIQAESTHIGQACDVANAFILIVYPVVIVIDLYAAGVSIIAITGIQLIIQEPHESKVIIVGTIRAESLDELDVFVVVTVVFFWE